MKRWLVIMVKDPRPGRVKTRLAADIGTIPATWWYRHHCRKTFRTLRDPRWTLVIAVSPDVSRWTWPSDVLLTGQGRGDLGQRMSRLIARFAGDPVLLIGSDIPGVGKTQIDEGFKALGRFEAVIGPATDGGYWALGMRGRLARQANPLTGVRWSTQHARADTVRALGNRHNLTFIQELTDVDDSSDLT